MRGSDALNNIKDRKHEFLKTAIIENVQRERVPLEYSGPVARILRDISAYELQFLIKHRDVDRFQFINKARSSSGGVQIEEPAEYNIKEIELDTEDAAILSGLMGLGICVSPSSDISSIGQPQYSPLASKVLSSLGM